MLGQVDGCSNPFAPHMSRAHTFVDAVIEDAPSRLFFTSLQACITALHCRCRQFSSAVHASAPVTHCSHGFKASSFASCAISCHYLVVASSRVLLTLLPIHMPYHGPCGTWMDVPACLVSATLQWKTVSLMGAMQASLRNSVRWGRSRLLSSPCQASDF